MNKRRDEYGAPFRRIPLAVIITLLVQCIGAVIWATQLDARVAAMEEQSVSTVVLNEKFARLEERLDNMKQDLSGMKRQLDRLTERFLAR